MRNPTMGVGVTSRRGFSHGAVVPRAWEVGYRPTGRAWEVGFATTARAWEVGIAAGDVDQA